jgi:hypothetical protein
VAVTEVRNAAARARPAAVAMKAAGGGVRSTLANLTRCDLTC